MQGLFSVVRQILQAVNLHMRSRGLKFSGRG